VALVPRLADRQDFPAGQQALRALHRPRDARIEDVQSHTVVAIKSGDRAMMLAERQDGRDVGVVVAKDQAACAAVRQVETEESDTLAARGEKQKLVAVVAESEHGPALLGEPPVLAAQKLPFRLRRIAYEELPLAFLARNAGAHGAVIV